MSKALMIGDLAAATGTKVNTIRFYEEIGLLKPATRTASNRRIYTQADLGRLRFVRHARKLGFETDEIRSLLALSDQPDRDCDEVNTIAAGHLADIEAKIVRLELLREELERIASVCAGGTTVASCRVLETLGDHRPVSTATTD
jgi:DNA-binding transcriptional MerR regulator